MLRHYTLSSFSRSWKFLPLSLFIKILKYFSFTGRIREGEIPLRAGRATSTNGEGSTLYQSTSARKRGLPNGCRTTKGKVWKAAGMTLVVYVLVFMLYQAGNQTSPLITFTLWPQCFSQKINFFLFLPMDVLLVCPDFMVPESVLLSFFALTGDFSFNSVVSATSLASRNRQGKSGNWDSATRRENEYAPSPSGQCSKGQGKSSKWDGNLAW